MKLWNTKTKDWSFKRRGQKARFIWNNTGYNIEDLVYLWLCQDQLQQYYSFFKGVMNWEIKILLIFWHIRVHCAIKTFCKFQNSKRSR